MVGAGHNGLIAACYLARAGWEVGVVERQQHIGGATSTLERLPGHRFDMHSVAHNMINMTDIVQDLRLAECGLEYQEMDPFSTMLTPDGQAVRFYRDLERTCQDIARIDPGEARRYRDFILSYDPLVRAGTAMFRRHGRREALASLPGIERWLRHSGAWGAWTELMSPYGKLLDSCCERDWMKAALSALAAHATVGPDSPGGAFYVMWQAAYHRFGMWHARGGSGALAQALQRRVEVFGGRVSTATVVRGLAVAGGRITGVIVDSGEMPADVVITTVNPRTVLGDWLPAGALSPALRRQIGATRTSNVVQFVVHVATDRLPPYRGAEDMPDAWNGMAALTRDLDQVARAFKEAELGLIPRDPPLYIFSPSAIDDSLSPAGSHSLYLASPAFPGRLARGGWRRQGMAAAERLVAGVEAYAPGFGASVSGLRPYTPEDMEADSGLIRGHPMHLGLQPDQLLLGRPLPGEGT